MWLDTQPISPVATVVQRGLPLRQRARASLSLLLAWMACRRVPSLSFSFPASACPDIPLASMKASAFPPNLQRQYGSHHCFDLVMSLSCSWVAIPWDSAVELPLMQQKIRHAELGAVWATGIRSDPHAVRPCNPSINSWRGHNRSRKRLCELFHITPACSTDRACIWHLPI